MGRGMMLSLRIAVSASCIGARQSLSAFRSTSTETIEGMRANWLRATSTLSSTTVPPTSPMLPGSVHER